MRAGEEVDENIVDQTCLLLKKPGPIMGCAEENLGQCFDRQDLEQNLKLTGQHASDHSVVCYTSQHQMVVENSIFFSWLELEGIFADKNTTDCTSKALHRTNINFQDCILKQDENVIKDIKDVKKAKEMATKAIMKCFDKTDNFCFSEREISFLRKDFFATIGDMMTVVFRMKDGNMEDQTKILDRTTVEVIGAIKDDNDNKNYALVNVSSFSSLLFALFVFL